MNRRGKSLKLVITFETPTKAFAFESMCKRHAIPGRLLPVPVKLTGGCGIGWTAKLEEKSLIMAFIDEYNLEVKHIIDLEF